ncbi:MAG: sporulation protein Cse60 [bacterium]
MYVKIFDFEHELDLENAVNDFIYDKNIIKILYQTSHFQALDEQIYSFSVLIYYE